MKRLRLVTDALPAFVAYVDSERRYQFNNKAYEVAFGVPRESMRGRYVWDVLGPERYEAVRKSCDAALAGETLHSEVTMTLEDGESRVFYDGYVPDIDEDGRVKGFYLLATDITEFNSMSASLRLLIPL